MPGLFGALGRKVRDGGGGSEGRVSSVLAGIGVLDRRFRFRLAVRLVGVARQVASPFARGWGGLSSAVHGAADGQIVGTARGPAEAQPLRAAAPTCAAVELFTVAVADAGRRDVGERDAVELGASFQ